MKNIPIVAISLLLIQCEPIVPQQSTINKKIIYDNHEYEDITGYIKLVPMRNGEINELENPVINMNTGEQLMLSFDLLTDKFENLGAKIYHCNKEWEKSMLRDMEFLSQINNFRITDFDYSVNTVQPYINYRFNIPNPTISGNYVISVFRRANPEDILFTRRFLVTEGTALIDHIVRVSTTIDKRESNHQIEYEVNYGDLLVNTPTKDIQTLILQNHNWNTVITEVPPTLIRANDGSIEYRHLDLTTNFPGWNEFRFADLRTLNVAGRNVSRVVSANSGIVAPLRVDKTRNSIPYTLNLQDINGNFVIANNDPGEDIFNADYVKTTFSLESSLINGDIYVVGHFNNWRLTDSNKMKYSDDRKRYEATIALKQGYYEYQYFVQSKNHPPYLFEGSHFQAENEYEILVYYRRPGNVHDQLIGYKKFRSIE